MNKYVPGVFASLYETALGQNLWLFLNAPDTLLQMETATALDRPAVEGIEDPLLEKFGEDILEDRVKQMIGHMVRQIMESRGYVIAVQNVKITNGAPFARATRYKRPEDMTFYVFQSATNARLVALTADKAGTRLPESSEQGKWVYWKSFRGGLRGRIAFGLDDEAKARAAIATEGYYSYQMPRLFRAGSVSE